MSFKMDLDFGECFRRKNTHVITENNMVNEKICSLAAMTANFFFIKQVPMSEKIYLPGPSCSKHR